MSIALVKFLKMRAEEYGTRLRLSSEDAPISYPAFDKITERLAYGLEKMGAFSFYSALQAGEMINDGHDTRGGIYVS